MNKGIPKKTVTDLELLFFFSSAKRIRKSVNYVYFNYLLNTHESLLPSNFKKISEDVYYLMNFLEKAHKRQKKNGKTKTVSHS